MAEKLDLKTGVQPVVPKVAGRDPDEYAGELVTPTISVILC
jgi:hypothetical protein